MSSIRYHYLIITAIFLILLIACTGQLEKDVVAQVDDIKITESEFQNRLNFNPYLSQIKNTEHAKKTVLSALIAEKVLALEAQHADKSDSTLNQLTDQYLKEAMIEQIRRDSVESVIQISNVELKKEYDRSVTEVEIKYVAFDDSAEAAYVKSVIDSMSDFEIPVREYMNIKGWIHVEIPGKVVKWAEEPAVLEKAVYQLDKNEVSNPVKWKNQYYLIKSENIKTQSRSSSDYLNKKPALLDRIRRRKISAKYNEFYKHYVLPLMGRADWQKLKTVVNQYSENISFSQTPDKLIENKPLYDLNISTSALKFPEDMNEPVIFFENNHTWSVKELLHNLKTGPYAFNYKNENLFRRSFARNIQLLLEHEALYQLASEHNYNKNEKVLREYNIWYNYYLSQSYRHSLLGNVSGDTVKIKGSKFSEKQANRLDFMDEYLAKSAPHYRIRINKDLFENIDLNQTNMVVVKAHFANRLIAPPLESLNILTQWTSYITKIFKENGID